MSEDDDLDLQTEFKVVPQDLDDAEMWDVNDLNEDELKMSRIKGIVFAIPRPRSRLMDILIRARPTHGRGSVPRSGTCQQKKNKNRANQRRLHALLSQFERRPPVVVS